MSSSKMHHIIPPDELCCVWMAAGILSYQLCDREYECETCPLDAALRKHFSHQAAPIESSSKAAPPHAGQEGLREGYRYSRNHCWIRQIGADLLRVGIEPSLSRALLAPRAVVSPRKGQTLQRGQTCLWIVMEGGTLPLESPCDGIVHGTNRQLADRPYLVQNQPFDDGWLLELQVEDAASPNTDLLEAEGVRPAYTAHENRFCDLLNSALRKGQPSVGTTLADGGQPLRNIADILGPSRYFSIVRKVYGA